MSSTAESTTVYLEPCEAQGEDEEFIEIIRISIPEIEQYLT